MDQAQCQNSLYINQGDRSQKSSALLLTVCCTVINHKYFLCLADTRVCADNPCEPNGVCTSLDNTFECTCFAGYIGPTCSILNFCSNAPCFNGGTCTNLETMASCQCTDRYTGSQCEIGKPSHVFISSSPCHSLPPPPSPFLNFQIIFCFYLLN